MSNKENLDNSAKLDQGSKKENMDNGSEIKVLTGDGNDLKLIFNETILLPKIDSTLSIRLPDEANKWLLTIYFKQNDNEEALNARDEYQGDSIFLYLNKWYSDTWIENTSPYHFFSKNNQINVYVKIRSSAMRQSLGRAVMISVWQPL